jgi:hypothetical protein
VVCELCALLDQISHLAQKPQLETFRGFATLELRALVEVGLGLLHAIDAALEEAFSEGSDTRELDESGDSL